jgi:hypothetical protein
MIGAIRTKRSPTLSKACSASLPWMSMTSQNVELAGEIADGVMPLWWSVEWMTSQ